MINILPGCLRLKKEGESDYLFYTKSYPKGYSASLINLKCCRPNGIPMIVMQRSKPKTSSAIAIQIPAKTIQIRLSRKDMTGIEPPVGVTFRPNGAKCAIPNFMA